VAADITFDSVGGWPTVLRRLSERNDLTASESETVLGEILAGEATDAQIAGFLVGLRTKGETIEELAGLLRAMQAVATPVPVDGDSLIDTCGTGGDGSHSINVSTIAAFVVAGAGGRVCKHGNRAVSSACGSADVLEALGVDIENDPDTVARCIERSGLGFCFAPAYHPAMRHVGPVRRQLAIPTVFNYLGPLANPARARRQVVGVNDPGMARRMVEVLRANGSERAMVVYGHDGLDELTTTATSTVLELCDGQIVEREVNATDYGLALVDRVALAGGDAAVNAGYLQRVLAGEAGAHRDIVVLNASAGLVVSGMADDLAEGVELARAVLDDGRAGEALTALVKTSSPES